MRMRSIATTRSAGIAAFTIGLASVFAAGCGSSSDDSSQTPGAPEAGASGAAGSGGSSTGGENGGTGGPSGSAHAGTAGAAGSTAGATGGVAGASAGGTKGGSAGASAPGGAAGATGGSSGASGGATAGAAGTNAGHGGMGGSGANGGTNSGGSAGAGGGLGGASAGGSPSAGAGGLGAGGGTCTTAGQACTVAITSGNGILDMTCTCVPCSVADATGDADCAIAYGTGSLCLAESGTNQCLPASGMTLCRSTSGTPAPGCSGGQVCDTDTNICGMCAQSSECALGSVCSGGACVPGDCVTSSDCTGAQAGQICGAAMANECGACKTDAACSGDATYSSANEPFCLSGACAAAPTGAATCSAGPIPATCNNSTNGDICCSGACVADTGPVMDAMGNPVTRCCGTGKQNCGSGEACVGNYCSTCAQVPTTGTGADTFYIDPINGNDGGTGINNTGCRFKTLARAVSAVGVPTAATTIVLLGDITVGYPLQVNTNVTISGGTAAAVASPNNSAFTPSVRTIQSSAAQGMAPVIEFTMSKKSALAYLVVDGKATASHPVQGQSGVAVQGNGQTGVTLDHVTVQNMSGAGILVGATTVVGMTTTNVGGGVTFGAGVISQGNGSASTPADGIDVAGTGTAIFDPTINASIIAGVSNTIILSNNTRHGIAVTALGAITILGNSTKQDVIASANVLANLSIAQSPGMGSLNRIKGLISTGASNGNGILLLAGSKVMMRDSISLGNLFNGVSVQSGAGASAAANDLSQLDLGSAGAPGGNTFQAVASATGMFARNGYGGICLSLQAAPTTTLSAEGNVFVSNATGAAVTCTGTTTDKVTFRAMDCVALPAPAFPLSIATGPSSPSLSAIDVKSCAN